jgi:hypothetical protein
LAFYGLVRFIPDLERQEPVNVGFIVAHDAEIRTHLVPDRIDNGSADIVRRFEGLLRHLIEEEQRSAGGLNDGPAFLAQLAFRRFSHFEIGEPRQVTCSQGGLDSLVSELTHRLSTAPAGVPELV